jgi:TDG/mug DNA glycosylase family protein
LTDRNPTVEIYERAATNWVDRRAPSRRAAAAAFGDQVDPDRGPVVDLGSGPGWYLPNLGPRSIGLDAAGAMLSLARLTHAQAHPLVQADLARPPFRRESLGGAWASNSYVHVDRRRLPAALAHLHGVLAVDAPIELHLFEGDRDLGPFSDDDIPGRRYSGWQIDHLRDVLVGAGFGEIEIERCEGDGLRVTARRLLTLPDSVGPGMRVLFCGLNPSVHAAHAGVGYIGPGNRFWPALEQAGLVTRSNDPWHALEHDHIGMTDLAKRTTARASDIERAEFAAGLPRLERLVRWLEPEVLCVVGLSGWRAAVDRSAGPGPAGELGGRPVWLMPSTSGLNTHTTKEQLVTHLTQLIGRRVSPGDPTE